MKTITKKRYEAPGADSTCLSQNDMVLTASNYNYGGGGEYGENDIIDNGEY